MFSPCHKFYNEKKEANTVHTTLYKLFQLANIYIYICNIKFTILTIFKSKVSLSMLTLLYNHHQYPCPELFNHPILKICID